MSDKKGSIPKLELRLNLSSPRVVDQRVKFPTPVTITPSSSCVPAEVKQENDNNNNNNILEYSNNLEDISLVLVGCRQCHMYAMVAKDNHRCPKCKSTTLLEFGHDNSNLVIKNQ
ncbi:hypothetical protein Fmac_027418 [Flemingia macrophylla]|uniref:GIR1-like zinc ribbon domain-containing protein n=1 Tax=Flemingia macrophylla TaxID=520843 RepID=A0ABD1LHM9_9FABA